MTRETCCERFMKFVLSYILALPELCCLAPFYRLYDKFKFEWFQSRRVGSSDTHKKKVAHVQDQVRKWHAGGRKSRMYTARKIWNTWNVHGLVKKDLTQIQVELDQIVEIDERRRVLTVEPGLMMSQLTSILIPKGWTIPVIPEFETLTIGGVICGTGIESNSNRCGLSSDICLEYEMVLSDGKVVTCSKERNSDLFYSIPWSHGTLGFLTAVKIPLIPARKYVELAYYPVDSIAAAKKLLQSQEHEFVEGMAFGPTKFVVMHGNMTNDADRHRGSVNHINRLYKPWFLKHVESFLERARGKDFTGVKYIEYIPLRDYYHRHTRSYFWEIPVVIPYGNNPLFRFLFGWIYPVNCPLLKRFTPKVYDLFFVLNHTLQDFMIPMHHLEKALSLVHDTVEIYPLWLCPCKFFKKPGMVHIDEHGKADTELYIDIGIYGTTPKKAEYDSELTTRSNLRFSTTGFSFYTPTHFSLVKNFDECLTCGCMTRYEPNMPAWMLFRTCTTKSTSMREGFKSEFFTRLHTSFFSEFVTEYCKHVYKKKILQ